MSDHSVSADNFAFICKWLHKQSGLSLESGKEYLVTSRLAPLIQKHKAETVDQLIERLRSGASSDLCCDVTEAMVTTETQFFRDIRPFESLKKVIIPELIERRKSERRLNIWSAASSSGQEPYSLAILLHEYFPQLSDWRIHFSATDLSQQMLDRSRAGCYTQLEVNRGLPTPLLLKWFRQEGATWRINDLVRNTVTFSQLNLTQPWPVMPRWDLICLRNVMIYFDNHAKSVILDGVARSLNQDGYLLLGGAETTLNLSDSFCRVEHLNAGFYQLKSP